MTTTYTYRLYQFENGLGQTVWQAKRPLVLGIWIWFRFTGFHDSIRREWDTREAALKWLRMHAQKELDEWNACVRAAKQAKLKLVVIEPIKIEL